MKKNTLLALILLAVIAITYFFISTSTEYDPVLFWHDVASNIVAWAALMLFTVYILDKKLKRKK